MLKLKVTNTVIADGLGFFLLSNSGEKLEVYDAAQAKFLEATMIEDVVVVDPPVDVPVEPTPVEPDPIVVVPVDPTPVDPPTDPVEPVPVDPPVVDPVVPTPVNPPTLPVGIIVDSLAGLTTALRTSVGDEIILVAPGNYGDFLHSGQVFAKPVTITSLNSDNPATFRSLDFRSIENLIIEDLSVVYTPTTTTSPIAGGITLLNCTNIDILGCGAKSGPMPTDGLLTGRGISVTSCKDIIIIGNDVSYFRRGILTASVDGLVISYNHVHDNRTSLLSGGNVSNVLVEYNHLERSNPNNFGGDGDHGDFIHYWTSVNQTEPSDNFVIRNNFIEQGGGTALLGIYLDNNANPTGFTNVVIENNIIHNSNGQGMRLEDVKGAVIRNNTLVQTMGDFRKAPRIRVEDGCRDIEITNNIVANTLAGAAAANKVALNIVETGTVVLPLISDQVGKFVGLPKENATIEELQQIPGAFPVGVGANLTASMIITA